MIAFWILKSFFQEIFFRARSKATLDLKSQKNKKNILSRLSRYEFYKNKKILKWEDIPILNKETFLKEFSGLNLFQLSLQEALAFDNLTTESKNNLDQRAGITIGLSTGTSGKQGAFVITNREIGLWCGSVLAQVLGLKVFKRQRVALVFRVNNPLYQSLQFGWIRFRFINFNSPMAEIAEGLKVFNPTILISVPNFLCRYMDSLPVREINPQMVISGADVLDLKEKGQLEEYFNLPLTEIYQATEGFLGLSCRLGKIHLNEDNYIIEKEWVSSQVFMPRVSDVGRKSQAIIRYQMDDLLTVASAPCSCGNPAIAIEKIGGRADHILSFMKSTGVPIFIYPDTIRSFLGKTNWYNWNYQITQSSASQLEFIFDKQWPEDIQSKIKNSLLDFFAEQKVSNLNISLKHSTTFESPQGKRQRIKKCEF